MTNNKQQTVVEWLCEKLSKYDEEMLFLYQEEIKEAKEMDKKRTINFTEDWYFNGPLLGGGVDVVETIQKHYNETYGVGEQ
jgi:hypothetical protein